THSAESAALPPLLFFESRCLLTAVVPMPGPRGPVSSPVVRRPGELSPGAKLVIVGHRVGGAGAGQPQDTVTGCKRSELLQSESQRRAAVEADRAQRRQLLDQTAQVAGEGIADGAVEAALASD